MKSYHFIWMTALVINACICTKYLIEKNYESAICTGILSFIFIFLLGYTSYDERRSEIRREKERKELENIRFSKKEDLPNKFQRFANKDEVDDINSRLSFLEGYVLGIDAIKKNKEK